jgi:hypothetical protein
MWAFYLLFVFCRLHLCHLYQFSALFVVNVVSQRFLILKASSSRVATLTFQAVVFKFFERLVRIPVFLFMPWTTLGLVESFFAVLVSTNVLIDLRWELLACCSTIDSDWRSDVFPKGSFLLCRGLCRLRAVLVLIILIFYHKFYIKYYLPLFFLSWGFVFH